MQKPLNLLINSSQQLIIRPRGDGMLLEILMPMRPQDASLGVVTHAQLTRADLDALGRYLMEGTEDPELPPAA